MTITSEPLTVASTPAPAAKAERAVPTRRISFEEALAGVPKHFAANEDLIASHLLASLSAVFPDGEDYFVRSVRHFRGEITDPALKRDVAGFIGQESVHGREHRALNDRLAELGYPTKRVEKVVNKVLTTRERLTSPKSNLAVTAALEHFTAVLAETLLTDEDFRSRIGDETVTELFMWHALEESEHKAVAFDVYRAVGGSERMRIISMKMIRKGFVLAMAFQTIVSLLQDRATYKPGRMRESWGRFKTTAFMKKELWEALREYDRKGFHPNDRDTEALVTEYRERFFGPEGTLNDKLTGAPAAA